MKQTTMSALQLIADCVDVTDAELHAEVLGEHFYAEIVHGDEETAARILIARIGACAGERIQHWKVAEDRCTEALKRPLAAKEKV